MCPTAISMNTYVLRIHILTNIVNLCGKSVLTRHPDTGLARLPQCQIRYLEYGSRKAQVIDFYADTLWSFLSLQQRWYS